MNKKKKNNAVGDDELGVASSSKLGGAGGSNFLGEPLIASE